MKGKKMNIRKLIVAVFAVAVTCFSARADYWDWSQYPEGTGFINLGPGVYTVTDADLPRFNTFGEVYMRAESAVLEIDISGNNTLAAQVDGPGQIRKVGAGALTLVESAGVYQSERFSRIGKIDLREGTIFCPQDEGRYFRLAAINIAEGATLVTCPLDTTIIAGLSGAGLLKNESSTGCYLQLNGTAAGPYVFSGMIDGPKLTVRVGGCQYLLGEANNNGGEITVTGNGDAGATGGGVLGVSKFGLLYQPSSAGAWRAIKAINGGAYIKYLGEGESSVTRGIIYGSNESDGAGYYVDAGDNGGVTFDCAWEHWYSRAERLILTGSNTTAACVLNNAITGDSDTAPTYIIKRGPGIWRMNDNAETTLRGGLAVEEGILQFTSLAEVGTMCSLGLGTCLQSAYSGAYDESKNVDYAFLLGGNGTRGTMEYVGSAEAVSATRKFAIKGEGEFRNSSVGGAVSLSGAMSLSEGSTLVLGGDSSASASFKDISGSLNLVKEGTGTWTVKDTQNFTGSVAVRSGTLNVNGPRAKKFTWFKFIVRGTDGGSYVRFRGIDFYDANGVRQLTADNMSFLGYTPRDNKWYADVNDYSNIQPGQYGWTMTGAYLPQIGGDDTNDPEHKDNDIWRIFDMPHWAVARSTDKVRVRRVDVTLDPSEESTWMPILIRVPSSINPLVRFDVLASHDDGGNNLRDWTLEASEDGVSWEEVARYDYDAATIPGRHQWFSNKGAYDYENFDRPGEGYDITRSADTDLEPFKNVTGISVAAGATIRANGEVAKKIAKLTIDCDGGNGTIDGFAFAESGVIDLVNGSKSSSINFVNVSDESIRNLNGWTVTRNGQPTAYAVHITKDRVEVIKPGLLMLLK